TVRALGGLPDCGTTGTVSTGARPVGSSPSLPRTVKLPVTWKRMQLFSGRGQGPGSTGPCARRPDERPVGIRKACLNWPTNGGAVGNGVADGDGVAGAPGVPVAVAVRVGVAEGVVVLVGDGVLVGVLLAGRVPVTVRVAVSVVVPVPVTVAVGVDVVVGV